MIRRVELRDSKTIADIYNEYVIHSVATFETKPLKEGEMRSRIIEIFKNFPYWVYEIDDRVVGYLLIRGNNGLHINIRLKLQFMYLPIMWEKVSGRH